MSDGEVDQDTYSEVWRIQCEARLLLSMSLEKRRDYLDKIHKGRRQALKDEMRRQWEANHGRNAA